MPPTITTCPSNCKPTSTLPPPSRPEQRRRRVKRLTRYENRESKILYDIYTLLRTSDSPNKPETPTDDTWSNKFPFRKVCTRMTLPRDKCKTRQYIYILYVPGNRGHSMGTVLAVVADPRLFLHNTIYKAQHSP